MDADGAEQRYLQEPVATLTPERAYEKRWAMTLLEQVLTALRQEYAEAGNRPVFEELADLLWGKDTWISYAQIGERLGMNEGAVRGAMHRLRERYRERLRAEVAHTVADPRDDEVASFSAAWERCSHATPAILSVSSFDCGCAALVIHNVISHAG